MGKEARRRAREKMEAGVIPIRIGKKVRARDRKKREAESRIFMPVLKGGAPLSKVEQAEVFARSRKVKEDVASGARAPGPVDLGDVDLPDAPLEVVSLIADALLRPAQRRRVHASGRTVSAASFRDDDLV